MTDLRRGWQPDPFGAHEFRFFSDDGKPTLLVRDGETKAHDPPPPAHDGMSCLEEPAVVEFRPEPAVTAPEAHPEAPREPSHSGLVTPPPTVRPPGVDSRRPPPPPMARPVKIAYGVILAAMAASAVALAFTHFKSHSGRPRAGSATTTTTTTSAHSTTSTAAPTTTLVLPSALQPSAAKAAADLVSSWASGNQAEAASVATAQAVTTLFASHYTAGLAIARGCSQAFSPIVCTYGPPGGAAPTDPIYQIDVIQSAGGWYVSSVAINN
jgi:hypothetical protein